MRRLLEPKGMRSLGYFQPQPGAAFQLVAELRFDDQATADAALAEHDPETQADIPSFTAAPPVILIGREQRD